MTNSRRKGISGELEACKLFKPYFPDVRRSFGQSRSGYEQPDIIGGVEKYFYVEVKRVGKKYSGKDICKWADKLESDYLKYKELTGNESKYLVLMSREDRWHWEIRVWNTGNQRIFGRITQMGEVCDWERFSSFFLPAVLSPTKRLK